MAEQTENKEATLLLNAKVYPLFDINDRYGSPIVYLKNQPTILVGTASPKIIDVENFTLQTSTENIKMADVIVTVLYNHDPKLLENFLDRQEYPSIKFQREWGKDIWYIQRINLFVECGYETDGEKYIILIMEAEENKWTRVSYYKGFWKRIIDDKEMDRLSRKMAVDALEEKYWEGGRGVQIDIKIRDALGKWQILESNDTSLPLISPKSVLDREQKQ